MELRIKELLKEKGITGVSLSEKVGITQPNMSNIVNAKTTPSLDMLAKIATALDVDITELFKAPDNTVISCPHCGKPIRIQIEKPED